MYKKARKTYGKMFIGWLVWVLDWKIPNKGFMVHHNSKSSLVLKVKYKHHLYKSLMELKESFLCKLNELFSLGRYGDLRYKEKVMCSQCV